MCVLEYYNHHVNGERVKQQTEKKEGKIQTTYACHGIVLMGIKRGNK